MKTVKTTLILGLYGIMAGTTVYFLMIIFGVRAFVATPSNTIGLFVLSALISQFSRLFDGERLSFIQQLAIHFVATFVLVLIANAVMHWQFLVPGNWIRFGIIFLAVYFAVWLGWYLQARFTVETINVQLQKRDKAER